eukprot:3941493-Rhodomonas_salina.5
MKFAGLAESGKAFHLMHEAVLGLGAIDTTFITALARILCEDYEVAQEEGTPLNLPPSELAIDVSSQAVVSWHLAHAPAAWHLAHAPAADCQVGLATDTYLGRTSAYWTSGSDFWS